MPRFADIDDTVTLDPACLERVSRQGAAVIIPVDFAGQPPTCQRCGRWHRHGRSRSKTPLMPSASYVHEGTEYRWLVCSLDLAVLSFHPVKHVTTGEGARPDQ